MANLNAVLNEHVQRLAGRVATSRTKIMRRLLARHRRDLAALKRQIAELQKSVQHLRKQGARAGTPAAATEPTGPSQRFRADGLKGHRARLGLSAADYGKLVGASGLSVYHWEQGKTRPRPAQIAKLLAVRGLGKREALARLADAQPDTPAKPKRKK